MKLQEEIGLLLDVIDMNERKNGREEEKEPENERAERGKYTIYAPSKWFEMIVFSFIRLF